MTDINAQRMHDAINAFLAALAEGTGPWGANPMVAVRDIVQSPQVQAMADAADGWEGEMAATEPRFFMDHGMIHDRKTGKHVTTDEDSVFCDGVVACCALLNELNSA